LNGSPRRRSSSPRAARSIFLKCRIPEQVDGSLRGHDPDST
jgi:hypothetical protein